MTIGFNDRDWREGMTPQEILRATADYWDAPGVGLTPGERLEVAAYRAGADALDREEGRLCNAELIGDRQIQDTGEGACATRAVATEGKRR